MICMEEATRYIALLRGVNISGKNKVPMAELKKAFEELGFGAIKTYLNSGNVIFSSNEENIGSLTDRIETTIKSGLVWIFRFSSYQKRISKIFCNTRLTGGVMKIRKSMII